MEMFLAQCATLLTTDYPLFFSVILAGLVGSISHCSVMCSPLVAAQMLRLKEERQPQSTLLYYHAGRLSSYVGLGVVAVSFSQLVFAGAIQPYTWFLLLAAGVTFVISALLPRKTHSCCSEKTQKLQLRINRLSTLRLAYYLRGMLMGFMPCGMVYAVLLTVATLNTVYEAGVIMFIFGLATLPALQFIGGGALRLSRYYPNFSTSLGRGVMVLNGLFLCGLSFNLLTLH